MENIDEVKQAEVHLKRAEAELETAQRDEQSAQAAEQAAVTDIEEAVRKKSGRRSATTKSTLGWMARNSKPVRRS